MMVQFVIVPDELPPTTSPPHGLAKISQLTTAAREASVRMIPKALWEIREATTTACADSTSQSPAASFPERVQSAITARAAPLTPTPGPSHPVPPVMVRPDRTTSVTDGPIIGPRISRGKSVVGSFSPPSLQARLEVYHALKGVFPIKTKRVAVGLLVLGLLVVGTGSLFYHWSRNSGSRRRGEGMVLIPAGSFQMGDAFSEGYSDEQPVHVVYVSAFHMDKYEVTKALWDEVAAWGQANGYDLKPGDGSGKAPDHPVVDVTWYEAVKWANARSEREGLMPCYTVGVAVYRTGESDKVSCTWTANGYRLPTEAEWEKAARGGCKGRRFPWCDADTITHSRANYESSSWCSYDTSPTRGDHPAYKIGSEPYTSPVGSFAPNGYGLYDMAGNVWEWCWDWYGEGYYAASPGIDPRGPASGSFRVERGGSWSYLADQCRVANRNWNFPRGSFSLLGFRLVRIAS